jgi:PAB-dependent poly(A)-specific ribonuclease subunit 3
MVENAKDTLCRNVTIYGKCRFEDKGEDCPLQCWRVTTEKVLGCAFNHDTTKVNGSQNMEMLVGNAREREAANANGRKSNNSLKKALNVDSPSFTPSLLSANDVTSARKPATISPKAASAAPFQPKSVLSSRFISHQVIAFPQLLDLKLEKDLSSSRENGLLTCHGRTERGDTTYSPGNSNSRLGDG